MRLLLDTHTLIWFLEDSPQLSERARELIENLENHRFLSIASLWEIAIKIGIGKLQLGAPFEQWFPIQLERNLIELLPVRIAHLNLLTILPLHHRDPFDRLLIAQAQSEGLSIVGADSAFDAYGVPRLW